MAEAKLKPVPNRYNETAIEAIETFDIKLEQARAISASWRAPTPIPADAHAGDDRLRPAGGLSPDRRAQRIIEPVIRRVSSQSVRRRARYRPAISRASGAV